MSRVIEIAQDLLRFPSITPDASVVLDYCAEFLHQLGFICERLVRGTDEERVDNLYATWGNQGNCMLFCGHLDVVPPGDLATWRHDPFGAVIKDGLLYGRGAVDMKGNIASYFAALEDVILERNPAKIGLALLLTGDEEGNALFGVRAVMPELVARGARWIGCLTGEPTSQNRVGDAFKHGRRGSLNGSLTVQGVQGHTGYPARADNAAHRIIDALGVLRAMPLDDGNANFEPSWLEITTVDVGNPTGNIIPGRASAHFNYRFNTEQSSAGLRQKAHDAIAAVIPATQFSLEWRTPSEPYLSPHGAFIERVVRTVQSVTGNTPTSTTVGGTSDSRFIHQHCPVVDFGLCGRGMHEANEAVHLDDLHALQAIYGALLRGA
ncbi:MAG: succinyl-diaminopimelate desuccinylase [Alphaproteobacteria bacterium]|nr:succinyl-diaminopimelate desuccinylase [Alphaproteobacteria bacterium]